jgi:hypothetical protein
MGDKKAISQIIDYIPTINFDKTNQTISLFETTIRFLGGLLSGKSCESPHFPEVVLTARQPTIS